MMKILIYENPFEHGEVIQAELLQYLKNHQVFSSLDFSQTLILMNRERVDFAILHHSSISQTSYLRENYPLVKYIGYTGQMGACWIGHAANGIGKEFNSKLAEIYDKVIGSPSEILDALAELKLGRKNDY